MASISDHSPLLLDSDGAPARDRRSRFQFENAWLMENDINDVVSGTWIGRSEHDLGTKIRAYGEVLSHWCRRLRSRFSADIYKCKRRLGDLQGKYDEVSVLEMREVESQLNRLLIQEEKY